MAKSDDKILKILEDLQEGQKALQGDISNLHKGQSQLQAEVRSIKTDHGKKIDLLLSGQSRLETIVETLATKQDVERVEKEVDKLKRRLPPHRAD